ncbi:MAG: DUF1971 domain-containing protein [Proteobacteria bacterium]|nr:DUF1971 domain-containing protein [Pseudomonadota bacterium]
MPHDGQLAEGAALPAGLRPYSRTAVFTQDTVPAALLKAHHTKDGAWALIRVLEGELIYRVTDPRRSAVQRVLTSHTAPGVIEPTILHAVEPVGAVRFFVEFHRQEAAP